MNPKTREILDDINTIEHRRRKQLATNVLHFIGREFRRRFAEGVLEITFLDGAAYLHINDTPVALDDYDFIGAHMRAVKEITEGYTRGVPDNLKSAPGLSNVDKAVAALDAIDVADPEAAHADADKVLLDALRAMNGSRIADAYERVVKRTPWWGTA